MAIDWTKIFEKYKGLWIALKDDEETVVGSGKSAQDALKEARENGVSKPILFRMPKELVNFAGYEEWLKYLLKSVIYRGPLDGIVTSRL